VGRTIICNTNWGHCLVPLSYDNEIAGDDNWYNTVADYAKDDFQFEVFD